MTIEEYFGSWSKVVDLKEADKVMRKLSGMKNVCPQIKDIFKAFRLCPLDSLRVVIIGQDCYPDLYKGKPRATGIAFANAPDVPEKDYSPSLSVLKESVIDYTVPHESVKFDQSLEKWEEQGVLLLNTALSCEVGKIGSHLLLWRPFIKSLLTNLSAYHTGIVYVLMGNAAQSLEDCIYRPYNHVIKIRHPSWYARQKEPMPHHLWSLINEFLIDHNGDGIEWYNNLLTD